MIVYYEKYSRAHLKRDTMLLKPTPILSNGNVGKKCFEWFSIIINLFYRDAVLTCVINTLTSIIPSVITFSILGFIAASQGTTVGDVVESGPGLVFITYPQVVLQLPGARIWAVVFFVMLAVGMASWLLGTRFRTDNDAPSFFPFYWI